jgi:hypothetical protein
MRLSRPCTSLASWGVDFSEATSADPSTAGPLGAVPARDSLLFPLASRPSAGLTTEPPATGLSCTRYGQGGGEEVWTAAESFASVLRWGGKRAGAAASRGCFKAFPVIQSSLTCISHFPRRQESVPP